VVAAEVAVPWRSVPACLVRRRGLACGRWAPVDRRMLDGDERRLPELRGALIHLTSDTPFGRFKYRARLPRNRAD